MLMENKATMTSREIAEMTGKNHSHLMRDIRAMEEAWVKVNQSKFGLVEYTDAKGEKRPMYELTKTECLYIATKFNDEARARLIMRWEELEKTNQPDFSNPATVLKLAQNWAEEQLKRIEAEALLEAQKPKVLFAEAVEASKTSILIGELAKILKQNGIEIGQNRLFGWLRENGYLISRRGTDYNMPTQKAMQLGLFEIKETVINHSDGHISVNKTPKIKGKGQTYFINKFLNREELQPVVHYSVKSGK